MFIYNEKDGGDGYPASGCQVIIYLLGYHLLQRYLYFY